MKRNRSGFTLIEFLIVLGLIAIMAAILFPVFKRAREKVIAQANRERGFNTSLSQSEPRTIDRNESIRTEHYPSGTSTDKVIILHERFDVGIYNIVDENGNVIGSATINSSVNRESRSGPIQSVP